MLPPVSTSFRSFDNKNIFRSPAPSREGSGQQEHENRLNSLKLAKTLALKFFLKMKSRIGNRLQIWRGGIRPGSIGFCEMVMLWFFRRARRNGAGLRICVHRRGSSPRGRGLVRPRRARSPELVLGGVCRFGLDNVDDMDGDGRRFRPAWARAPVELKSSKFKGVDGKRCRRKALLVKGPSGFARFRSLLGLPTRDRGAGCHPSTAGGTPAATSSAGFQRESSLFWGAFHGEWGGVCE